MAKRNTTLGEKAFKVLAHESSNPDFWGWGACAMRRAQELGDRESEQTLQNFYPDGVAGRINHCIEKMAQEVKAINQRLLSLESQVRLEQLRIYEESELQFFEVLCPWEKFENLVLDEQDVSSKSREFLLAELDALEETCKLV